MAHCRRTSLLALLATAVLLPQPVASASVTGISIRSTTALGTFAGKPYRELAIQLSGTAPGGAYSVPVRLAHPSRRADANGFAVLDPYNTVQYWSPGFPLPPTVVPWARAILGEQHLFGAGHVYVSVLWDKVVAEARGEGSIAASTDAYDVLRDVSTLVRSPRRMPYPRGFERPPSARRVIAFGYSQTSNLLRDFYARHENRRGRLAFDGALLGGSGATCVNPADLALFYVCSGAVSDGGKVIVVNTEADAELAGFEERGQTAGYRVLELAGVAHISAALTDFRASLKPDQNPASPRPAMRAALDNLRRWIGGTRPPKSRYIRLKHVTPVDLGGFPYVPSERDRDGNAVGGVRLPHMPSIADGRPAGAPLGTYRGLDLDSPNVYLFLSGAFTPFSPARLAELYPRRAVYVARVRRAADRLLKRRLILEPDRDAYVRAAARRGVP